MPKFTDLPLWVVGVLFLLFFVEEYWVRPDWLDSESAGKKEELTYIGIGLVVLLLISYWKPLLLTIEIIAVIFILGVAYILVRYRGNKEFWERIHRSAEKWMRGQKLRLLREKRKIRHERRAPTSVTFERTSTSTTPAGFVAHYTLMLKVEGKWEDVARSNVNDPKTQNRLAEEYEKTMLVPFFEELSAQFHFRLGEPLRAPFADVVQCNASSFFEKDGQRYCRLISSEEWNALSEKGLSVDGMSVRLPRIVQNIFPNEAVERNYAMISTEDKKAVEQDSRYRTYDEILAIAALKRRLDFERQQFKQVHESDWVTISTEQAGPVVEIKWEIKQRHDGLELLGYRKTGGFSPDQFEEASNGALVVQTTRSGKTFEPLKEGETHFYTFLWRRSPKPFTYWAASRFQVTLMMEEERRLIGDTIRRIEGSENQESIDPAISRALKELGRYRQFETAMRIAEKEAVADIEKMPLADSEKSEEISKLRDQVAFIREKYQQ